MKSFIFVVSLTCCSMIVNAGGLQQGLVLHYSFNKPAGTLIPDDSGAGCDGKNVGATPEPAGVNGSCLRFDGVQSFVRAVRNPTTNGQYSVSLWFKPDSVEPASLENRNMIAMNRRYQIGFEINGPHLRFYSFCLNAGAYGYGALRADSGIFDLKPGLWNHVVMLVDGGAGFYLNGRLLGYISGPGANRGNLELLIGAMNNDPRAGPRYFFPGLLDEIRVYDRALTDEEITALFRQDAPKELLPPAPVALGPSYVIKEGRFYLRSEQGGEAAEHLLADDEVAKLLADAGVKAGVGTERPEKFSVCEIGFSNDAKGDQDVTYFLPGETLHVRVNDADMPSANTNFTVQVFLSQKQLAQDAAGARQKLLQLARARGGAFKGELPLAEFRPGPVWISVVANEGGNQPVLMRSSRIEILDPRPAAAR